MEFLDDKTRRYREEILEELKSLESRALVLKEVIRTLDNILGSEKPPKSPKVQKEPKPVQEAPRAPTTSEQKFPPSEYIQTPGPDIYPRSLDVPVEGAPLGVNLGMIGMGILSSCNSWKTVSQLAKLKKFQNRSKSNLGTRCQYLWKMGLLERQEKTRGRRNSMCRKEYRYRTLNTAPLRKKIEDWRGREPFDKILKEWFGKNNFNFNFWYTINDLKKVVPGLKEAHSASLRHHLRNMVKEGVLVREGIHREGVGNPVEYRYRRNLPPTPPVPMYP